MSTYKVRTPYLKDFKMPPNCVACGSPADIHATKTVSLTKNIGGDIHSLTLNFPLCSECQTVSQKKTGEGGVIGLTVLVVIVLIIVSASLSDNNETSIYFILGVVLSIVLTGFTTFWIIRNNQKLFTKDQLARKTQLMLSATINNFELPWMGNKEGTIEFRFFDSSFSEQFAKLNQGSRS